jgi:hypothetical protein
MRLTKVDNAQHNPIVTNRELTHQVTIRWKIAMINYTLRLLGKSGRRYSVCGACDVA